MTPATHATLPALATALALLLALPAATPAAEPVAEGTVSMREVEWRVADAMAWQDRDELEIVFTDTPFDRAAMRKDGKLDTFDFLLHEGNRLAINLGADGPTMCLDFMIRVGDSSTGGSQCNSDFPAAIEVSARTPERVAGSMQWKGEGEHVELRFDVPVEASP